MPAPAPCYPGTGAASDVEVWREILRDSIVEMDATPLGPPTRHAYTGWVNVLDLGAVSISDVASDPVRVARTPRLINRNPVDFCHLLLARRPSRADADTHHVRLRPGDAVVVDSTRPYSLTADRFAHYLSINVPRAALRRDSVTAPVGRIIPAEDPMLRVLAAVVTELGRNVSALTADALAEVGHTTYELLMSTLNASTSADTRAGDVRLSRTAQLARMRDFIRRHLADPALSPRMLADAFGVSIRYVELVFREADSSPARSIRDTRLDEARRMLADPRQGHRSIASIAHSVGIGDPDVLARAFRNRYGTTPSEYRHHRVTGAH